MMLSRSRRAAYARDEYVFFPADDDDIQSLIGPAESVPFIQCNFVHASAHYLARWRHALRYFVYNPVLTMPRKRAHPRLLRSDDFTAIVASS